MGSFSWLRAEEKIKGRRSNLTFGDEYKILIPKEFGGGFIIDTYFDYGYLFYGKENQADLYGILAYWNKCENMIYEGNEYPITMDDIIKRGNTCNQNNRCKGIDIGCYNNQIDLLKYPLKLVSIDYDGTYEDCPYISYSDPDQGFYAECW